MGFYSEWFLPWIMERLLSLPEVQRQRDPALEGARGLVLEIGFGFGGSLSHYPAAVDSLIGLEPNPGMLRRARRRLASAPFPVTLVRSDAETMPFKDASFDVVISNWTLCSVKDAAAALREVRRVLRPGGHFLFLEHGLAGEPRLARWQRRLNPLHARVAGGCRLDLPVEHLVRDSGLTIERCERYESTPGPRFLTQMYRGSARREGAAA